MIILSELIWETLLDEFKWPRRQVERVAYIDGLEVEGTGVATTLTFPNAELHPTYFTVSGEAMSEAGQHFRKFGLRRIAQVHTHPSRLVDHSPFDDDNAYSQLDGAVSIVLPSHARHRPGLLECGVHVREADGWRRLSVQQVRQHIQCIPGCLDFRRGR